MAKATAIYVDWDVEADLNDEYRVWLVYAGDDSAEPTGHVQRFEHSVAATEYANAWGRNTGLEVVIES